MERIHQVRFKTGLQAGEFLHAVCAKTGKEVCYWTEHSHTVTRGKTFNTELEGLNNNLTDGEAALAEGAFSKFSAFTFKSLTATGAEEKKQVVRKVALPYKTLAMAAHLRPINGKRLRP